MFDSLFNMYKIRYVDMNKLLINNCKELKANSTFNVFINLEMIIRKMTNKNILDYMNTSRVDKYKDVIAQVINLVAHYRRFFTSNKHKSYIYLYMGYPFSNKFDNFYYMDYRESYINRFAKATNATYLTQTLNNSLPIVKMMSEYLDGIYFLNSNVIEPSLIPYIIHDKFKRADINLVITNDIYDFQYAKIDTFYPIRISKGYHYIVTKENCIEKLKLEEKIYNSNINKVTVNQLPFILSVIGDNKRDIKKLPKIGLSTILKVIQEGIEENKINENTDNINLLCDLLPKNLIDKVITNYLVTDLSAQYENHKNEYYNYLAHDIIDRFDNASLMEISNKYFIDTPLMIEELNNYNNDKRW